MQKICGTVNHKIVGHSRWLRVWQVSKTISWLPMFLHNQYRSYTSIYTKNSKQENVKRSFTILDRQTRSRIRRFRGSANSGTTSGDWFIEYTGSFILYDENSQTYKCWCHEDDNNEHFKTSKRRWIRFRNSGVTRQLQKFNDAKEKALSYIKIETWLSIL